MNRANFTNRPKLSQGELQEAAIQIRNRMMSQENKIKDDLLETLAQDTYNYLERYNSKSN